MFLPPQVAVAARDWGEVMLIQLLLLYSPHTQGLHLTEVSSRWIYSYAKINKTKTKMCGNRNKLKLVTIRLTL